MKRILLIFTALAAILSASAQEAKVIRPVSAAYTASIGAGAVTDTYLSPIGYSGLAFSLDYERSQAMRFSPDDWTMRLAASAQGIRALNPAGNKTMWDGNLRLQWGMHRRWRLPQGIIIGVGGSTTLQAGCIYSSRGGNNPASAKAAWTVDLSAYAIYNLRIGRLPVTLTYRPTLPLTGAFFAPEYGELYYEIYLGNRSGLAHCAWWGNRFEMENLVTADLHLGSTTLRIGYRGNILSTRINGINTRVITNAVVIGVSLDWMALRPGTTPSPDARIITATY